MHTSSSAGPLVRCGALCVIATVTLPALVVLPSTAALVARLALPADLAGVIANIITTGGIGLAVAQFPFLAPFAGLLQGLAQFDAATVAAF